MQSAVGQCVALVTYAQLALEGNPEPFDWKSNPWFAHTAEYRFGVGKRGGPVQAEDPAAWIEGLSQNGFRSAALFVEPYNGSRETINFVGFAGGLRIAPVTTMDGGEEIIWHEETRFDPVAQAWHVYRGGFRVMPGQDRVRVTMDAAESGLRAALEGMVEFQRTHRAGEPYFAEMFDAGLAVLDGRASGEKEQEALKRAREMFPTRHDLRAVRLVASVEASWALGGMGWWNDWGTGDEAVERSFHETTETYYCAMMAALAAACVPRSES
ncbi:hypothetical protein EON82_09740 [bacterium]|nr:MAG: hypothetical protein EON82_09740 [bacterium]